MKKRKEINIDINKNGQSQKGAGKNAHILFYGCWKQGINMNIIGKHHWETDDSDVETV